MPSVFSRITIILSACESLESGTVGSTDVVTRGSRRGCLGHSPYCSSPHAWSNWFTVWKRGSIPPWSHCVTPLQCPPALALCKAPVPEGLPSSGQEGGSPLDGGKVQSLGYDIPEIIQRTPGGCSCLLSPLPGCGGGRTVRRTQGWRR